MTPLTPKEIRLAYAHWSRDYLHEKADQQIEAFLDEKIQCDTLPLGWLEKARKALFLSTGRMANRLEISRAAYRKFEKNEELGTISLNSLKRCVEAMNCELVYAIRPRERVPFSQVIWEKILKGSAKQIEIRKSTELRKSFTLAAIARDNIFNAKFRKQQQWSQS
ncbi:MAG: hypothetical protein SGJ18_10535 [Pseudomonadota bacterium]|nr:hypothetical protein [Pseudomonadota bacterium]